MFFYQRPRGQGNLNIMINYTVPDKNGKKILTDTTLHPGELSGGEILARGIKQKDFAREIDLLPPHLNDLLKGKRHVSARIAAKLESALGIDAGYWLRLQMSYDLTMARKDMKL